MKKDSEGNDISKLESKYNRSDLEVISRTYRAMNQLYCALNGMKFNRVSSCSNAKEINMG